MIYILVPSYNELGNFESLLESVHLRLKKLKYSVIIVDDGSTDDTKKLILHLSGKYPVKRIGYSKNRGPGYAFKFGFDYLIPKLKANDLVVTMEADNTSDFKILNKMIKLASSHDVVLASPYAKGGRFKGVTFKRLLLSQIANFLDRIVFRIDNVKTFSSFYRVYRASILKKAKEQYDGQYITENGFGVFVEFLVKLSNIDASIVEVPAVVDWRKRVGKSKNKLLKAIVFHFLLYIKFFKGEYSLCRRKK